MRKVAQSLAMILLAVAAVIGLAVSSTMTTAVVLTATKALIMSGTSVPTPSPGYVRAMTRSYIDPFFGTSIAQSDQVAVTTPEEFAPFVGELTFDESVAQGVEDLEQEIAAQRQLGNGVITLGHSQSTRIQTITKRNIIAQAQAHGGAFEDYPDVKFAMVSNVNKPNGGIQQRLAPFGGLSFLGTTFDGATPTNSPANEEGDYALETKDYSFVHDGFSDLPVYPLNVLALVNAIAGIMILHNDYLMLADIGPDSPDFFYQGSHGDTDYYVIRTEIVPILLPLGELGVPRPVLLFLDEPARVMIETGYEREISPGEPTTVRLIGFKNPITVALNLIASLAVGFDDAAEDVGAGRPFGTTPSGPFGVGGPTGPIADPTDTSPRTTQDDDAALSAARGQPASARRAAQPESDTSDPARDQQPTTGDGPGAEASVSGEEATSADEAPDTQSTAEESAAEDSVGATSGNSADDAATAAPATGRSAARSVAGTPRGAQAPSVEVTGAAGDRPLSKAPDALSGQPPSRSTDADAAA